MVLYWPYLELKGGLEVLGNLSGIVVVFSAFLEGSWPCVFDSEHEGSSDSANVL